MDERVNKVTATLPIKVPLPNLPRASVLLSLSASFDAVLVAEAFTCPREFGYDDPSLLGGVPDNFVYFVH